MKILLVDSDPTCRFLVAQGLMEMNHEVLESDGGENAWMMFRVQSPRVVIASILPTDKCDLELLRRIRDAKDAKYAYIIALTSEASKTNYLAAMNAGADDVLAKPCDVADIALRLRVAERLLQLRTKVHQLEGLLPICSYCKRIKDDSQEWQPVDRFVNQRSEVSFSHGVCPECYHEHIEPQLQKQASARFSAKSKDRF